MLCSPSMPKTHPNAKIPDKKKKINEIPFQPPRPAWYLWDTLLVDPYIRSIKKLLQGNNLQSIIVFKYFDTFLNADRLKVN